MEHETPVPELAERLRPRPVRHTPEPAAHELSRAEQAAIAGGAGAPATALRSSVIGLQRTAGNAAVTSLLEQSLAEDDGQQAASPVLDVVGKGRGQPLHSGLRDEMEARLGQDFSDVRIHTDAQAAASAGAVSARAYTVGNEVVFGAAAPALDTAAGKRTLAHELTHVIQQRQGPVAGTPTGDGIAISDPSDRFEQAAEANADRVMADGGTDRASSRGGDASIAAGAALVTQRQPEAVEEDEEQAAEYQEEAAEYQEEAAEYQEEAAEASEEGAEEAGEEEEEGGEEEEEEG